ncbi:hypothetical protein PV08_08982 [Exophiala spinifera]|uniref:Rieske domain-containing protein n=1 Tax=Exophiala spinifera TaxID=91928 RepID=A0A0D2B514_9EURO|nr:uncharacterized protein PV08_08982 [Exophiala spinifera]KIW13790.1 hypothetical protein PV08_08982 [Exophiala spinifera]
MNGAKANKTMSDSSLGAALPASWYSSRGIYELESRAIFSRQWLTVTHELRLAAPGAYAKFTITGYRFFIIRARNGDLNAFLKMCQHRAFPVVLQDEGTASLTCLVPESLSNRQSWSYGLNGKLAKVPNFDKVGDFDKSQYGVFRVHVKVDVKGFAWVNLDGALVPAIKWENSLPVSTSNSG